MTNETSVENLVVRNTPANLFQTVEDLVWQYDITYWEALNRYVEVNELEIDNIKPLIDSRLKSILEKELDNRNLLKRAKRETAVLDI